MIGLAFRVEDVAGSILADIFSGTPIEQFVWVIGDSEILHRDDEGRLQSSIFDKEVLEGTEFRKRIELPNYRLINADIKAFSSGKRIEDIESYGDYLQSDCVLALFCIDTVYVEVYCKTESVLDAITQNCTRFGFKDMALIASEDEIPRASFSIWQ